MLVLLFCTTLLSGVAACLIYLASGKQVLLPRSLRAQPALLSALVLLIFSYLGYHSYFGVAESLYVLAVALMLELTLLPLGAGVAQRKRGQK